MIKQSALLNLKKWNDGPGTYLQFEYIDRILNYQNESNFFWQMFKNVTRSQNKKILQFGQVGSEKMK